MTPQIEITQTKAKLAEILLFSIHAVQFLFFRCETEMPFDFHLFLICMRMLQYIVPLESLHANRKSFYAISSLPDEEFTSHLVFSFFAFV